jgi:hypothetical protein
MDKAQIKEIKYVDLQNQNQTTGTEALKGASRR